MRQRKKARRRGGRGEPQRPGWQAVFVVEPVFAGDPWPAPPAGRARELQQRRERAIALLERGRPLVEVARLLRVNGRSVRRWTSAYRRAGLDGLAARRSTGRPSMLTARQRARLQTLLIRGESWTWPRIADVIRGRFGIRYHAAHVGRLLRSLGMALHVPRRQRRIAPWQRDDETDAPPASRATASRGARA